MHKETYHIVIIKIFKLSWCAFNDETCRPFTNNSSCNCITHNIITYPWWETIELVGPPIKKLQEIKCSENLILLEVYSIQKWCTQTFWSKVFKADLDHGLETRGGGSDQKVALKKMSPELNFSGCLFKLYSNLLIWSPLGQTRSMA